VHFLWQGTFIALLAVLAAALLRRASSRARYGAYVAALLLMAASPPVTCWVVGNVSLPGASRQPMLPEAMVTVPPRAPNVELEPHESRKPPVAHSQPVVLAAKRRSTFDWQRYAAHAAACYLFGVVLMVGRLLLAVQAGQQLGRRAQPVDDPAILAAAVRWAKALGLSLTPAVAYCRRIAVPTVVGVLRPTVLLPLSLASGLSPEQVEMSLLA